MKKSYNTINRKGAKDNQETSGRGAALMVAKWPSISRPKWATEIANFTLHSRWHRIDASHITLANIFRSLFIYLYLKELIMVGTLFIFYGYILFIVEIENVYRILRFDSILDSRFIK